MRDWAEQARASGELRPIPHCCVSRDVSGGSLRSLGVFYLEWPLVTTQAPNPVFLLPNSHYLCHIWPSLGRVLSESVSVAEDPLAEEEKIKAHGAAGLSKPLLSNTQPAVSG